MPCSSEYVAFIGLAIALDSNRAGRIHGVLLGIALGEVLDMASKNT